MGEEVAGARIELIDLESKNLALRTDSDLYIANDILLDHPGAVRLGRTHLAGFRIGRDECLAPH